MEKKTRIPCVRPRMAALALMSCAWVSAVAASAAFPAAGSSATGWLDTRFDSCDPLANEGWLDTRFWDEAWSDAHVLDTKSPVGSIMIFR